MTERFDEANLRNQLAQLTSGGLVVFALSCTERMLPNYRRFFVETGWGDESPLREALDMAWRWLETGEVDFEAAQKLREACESRAPDTEDFSTILVSAALDAAGSSAATVELMLGLDPEIAIQIANHAIATVDLHVQEMEDMHPQAPDLEERIRLHPLMQLELRNQREALEAISGGIEVAAAVTRWRSPERGSIDSPK